MTTIGHNQGANLMQEIVSKCWEDESFKQELLANPAKTVMEHFPMEGSLPKGMTFKAYDFTDESKSYLPIPAQQNWDELELTDEQLEMVAGGDITVSAAVTYVATAALFSAACYAWGRWG